MQEQSEILNALREGFGRVDEQFLKVRGEFAEQLDRVSDGLHLELKAQSESILERAEAVRATIEEIDGKIGLLGENVANVITEISRYHDAVESPVEAR